MSELLYCKKVDGGEALSSFKNKRVSQSIIKVPRKLSIQDNLSLNWQGEKMLAVFSIFSANCSFNLALRETSFHLQHEFMHRVPSKPIKRRLFFHTYSIYLNNWQIFFLNLVGRKERADGRDQKSLSHLTFIAKWMLTPPFSTRLLECWTFQRESCKLLSE